MNLKPRNLNFKGLLYSTVYNVNIVSHYGLIANLNLMSEIIVQKRISFSSNKISLAPTHMSSYLIYNMDY